MTMAGAVTEIDRLIEQGLGRYGEGDLDGALLLWEQVLAIDPENPQANSYVEYVRMNYELLASDGNAEHTEHSGPFGIGDDDPEYQIEILPGEVVRPASAAPLFMDARDEGWAIGDELPQATGMLMVELEADEPPIGGDPGMFENTQTGETVSFEDATREYPGGAGRPASMLLGVDPAAAEPPEFIPEVTPAFGGPDDLQTPQDFGSQLTDVRPRDLGFVQPAEAARSVTPGPPELPMALRTPGSQAISLPPAEPGPDPHRAPAADRAPPEDDDPAFEAETPPATDLASAYAALDLELVGRADTRPAMFNAAADASELFSLLPTPRLPTPRPPISPATPLPARSRVPAADVASPHDRPSRDLPPPVDLPPALGGARAPTQTLPSDPALAVPLDPQPAAARDFSDQPTQQLADRARPLRPNDPVISAPTRDLGLRKERRPSTEEETTGHFEVHHPRITPRGGGKLDLPGMDPIDVRSAEILEDVDRDAPASEAREDRTRRRITALLERATGWGEASDVERAVAAVDLALSEDPNSALAQKLIHRNRETIMNAFQGFLGDLQRTPALVRPLHELGSAPISPRAAFLLSRIDGTLSLDEILDVSGMPRIEAYRYLCQLFLRGILR
jgi:hypothetical protein